MSQAHFLKNKFACLETNTLLVNSIEQSTMMWAYRMHVTVAVNISYITVTFAEATENGTM